MQARLTVAVEMVRISRGGCAVDGLVWCCGREPIEMLRGGERLQSLESCGSACGDVGESQRAKASDCEPAEVELVAVADAW